MNGKFVVNEQFEKHYNQAVVNIAGNKAYGSGARHAADSTGVSLNLSGVTSLAFVQIGKKLFQISGGRLANKTFHIKQIPRRFSKVSLEHFSQHGPQTSILVVLRP